MQQIQAKYLSNWQELKEVNTDTTTEEFEMRKELGPEYELMNVHSQFNRIVEVVFGKEMLEEFKKEIPGEKEMIQEQFSQRFLKFGEVQSVLETIDKTI